MQWMVCPRRDLAFGELACDTPAPFVAVQYSLTDLWQILPDFLTQEVRPALWAFMPQAVRDAFASITWTCMPAQMHAVALAAFASIIGPFGATPHLPRHPSYDAFHPFSCASTTVCVATTSCVGTGHVLDLACSVHRHPPDAWAACM